MQEFEAFALGVFSDRSHLGRRLIKRFASAEEARKEAERVGPRSQVESLKGKTLTIFEPPTNDTSLWRSVMRSEERRSVDAWVSGMPVMAGRIGLPGEHPLTFGEWCGAVWREFGDWFSLRKPEPTALRSVPSKQEGAFEVLVSSCLKGGLAGFDADDVREQLKDANACYHFMVNLGERYRGSPGELSRRAQLLTDSFDAYKKAQGEEVSQKEAERFVRESNRAIAEHNELLAERWRMQQQVCAAFRAQVASFFDSSVK